MDKQTDSSSHTSNSDSESSDEIEIVRELKVNLDEHRCDLCCQGSFLVNKLLQFGGIENKYACEICFQSFKTKSQASKHAKTHSETKQALESRSGTKWNCPLCPFHTFSETGFKRHTTNQHKAPHTCGRCGLTYKSEKSFAKHCATHPDDIQRHSTIQTTKNCKTCRKSFLYERSFNEHVCHVT